MAAGPLSLLGDAIAGGARDFANIQLAERERARAREERLADEARHREYRLEDYERERGDVKEDVADARAYEQKLYDERRSDAMINQLVNDRLLLPKDIGNPDAIEAAFKRGGPDYALKLQELTALKAMAPKLGEADVLDAKTLEMVLAATPDQLEQIRAPLSKAVVDLGKRDTNNAKVTAAMLAVNMAHEDSIRGQAAEVQRQLADLSEGAPLDDETEYNLRRSAENELYPGKKIFQPNERAAIDAKVAELRREAALPTIFALQTQLKGFSDRLRGVKASTDNVIAAGGRGLFTFTDPATVGKAPPTSGAGSGSPPDGTAPQAILGGDPLDAFAAEQQAGAAKPPNTPPPGTTPPPGAGVRPPPPGARVDAPPAGLHIRQPDDATTSIFMPTAATQATEAGSVWTDPVAKERLRGASADFVRSLKPEVGGMYRTADGGVMTGANIENLMQRIRAFDPKDRGNPRRLALINELATTAQAQGRRLPVEWVRELDLELQPLPAALMDPSQFSGQA